MLQLTADILMLELADNKLSMFCPEFHANPVSRGLANLCLETNFSCLYKVHDTATKIRDDIMVKIKPWT